MKHIVSKKYKHRVIAPKGFKFDFSAITSGNCFDEHETESLDLTLNGHILSWESILGDVLPVEFWEEQSKKENWLIEE